MTEPLRVGVVGLGFGALLVEKPWAADAESASETAAVISMRFDSGAAVRTGHWVLLDHVQTAAEAQTSITRLRTIAERHGFVLE